MLIHFGCCMALLSFLFLCSPVVAQDKPKIFLGAASKTLGYSPLWVGTKKGFFDQQGLDVQLVLVRGVPMTLQSLVVNSLHIGSGGPEPYMEATERGLDFVSTGGTVTAFREALKQKGLEYPKGYKLLAVTGGSAGNLAALQTGQISATTVAAPLNYAAEEFGCSSLLYHLGGSRNAFERSPRSQD